VEFSGAGEMQSGKSRSKEMVRFSPIWSDLVRWRKAHGGRRMVVSAERQAGKRGMKIREHAARGWGQGGNIYPLGVKDP